MQRKWIKTTAATMALLAIMGSSARASESSPAEQPAITEAVPIRAELVTLEGQITESAAAYLLDGWTLVGDVSLFARLKGQQVWVLGTNQEGQGAGKLTVDRIERKLFMNRQLPQKLSVNGKAPVMDQAPYMHKGTLMLPLRALVEAAGGKIEWNQETWTAYVLMADRTAYITVGESKAQMHLHAALYREKNYVTMDQSVVLQNGRMFISADAVSSVLGLVEAVRADESVLNLLFPAGQFDVAEPGNTPPGKVDLTFDLEWIGDRLQISGKTALSDLRFVVKLYGKVLGQADVTVKDGYYIANVLVEGGRGQAGVMDLEIIDPANGWVLLTTSANNHHR